MSKLQTKWWEISLKYIASLQCNNEDLLLNCGISPLRDILKPDYYTPKTLKWTRYLGYSSINPALKYLPYDPMNNCSQSMAYSLTCQLNLQMKSLPKARHCQTQSKRIIDDCSLNTNAYICRLYRMAVSYNGYIYANPHCAECNGIQMNTTQCSGMLH